MNILEIPAGLRTANRLRQIAGTLIKYELISVKESLTTRPGALLPKVFGRVADQPDQQNTARLVRHVVQDLGTTYIKFGQWLSVRPDFVPPDIIQELEKLQDRLPPVPFATIKRTVERELKKPIEEAFADFDQYPLSTASIAQVHRAVLKSGEHVAVKVQHPNLRRKFTVDLAVIRSLSDWAVARFPHLALHRPDDLITSFKNILMDEIDFMLEGKNQERIARNFERTPWMRIPRVYWDYTTEKVLVMEYLDGFKLKEEEFFDKWQLDRKRLAARLSRSMFRQIFKHGIFHSDPHPGNILFMRGNHIGLIDFGIVAKHGDDLRNKFLDWFYASIYRDVDLFEETFLAVGKQLAPLDRIQFRSDCIDYIDEMHFQPAGRISFARVLASTNRILYRHKISPPPTFLFFFKAISTIEGVIRRIDPDFDWRDDWGPRLRKLVNERYSLHAIVQKYSKVARQYDRLIATYPDDVRDVLKRIKDGKFETEMSMPELKTYVDDLKVSLNKVAAALIFAAVIFGLFQLGRGQDVEVFIATLNRVMREYWWMPALLLLIALYFRKR
jgi:ubiquinone biosynthesis protein